MKILDKLISIFATLFLSFVAIIFILLPFNGLELLSLNNIIRAISAIRGDYLYSMGGAFILIISIKALFSEVFKSPNKQNHIITPMTFGDLRISDEAIEGLTHNVISRIVGIRSSKIIVDFKDGYIFIEIRGQVATDANIPSVTDEIQNTVKEVVESNTGMQVSRVNVEVLSISSPTKSLK